MDNKKTKQPEQTQKGAAGSSFTCSDSYVGVEFVPREDGEGIEVPPGECHMIACCDCGLVHRMAVAIEENGNIGLAFERDDIHTQHRRNEFDPNGNRMKLAPIVNTYHREVWGLTERVCDLLDEIAELKRET